MLPYSCVNVAIIGSCNTGNATLAANSKLLRRVARLHVVNMRVSVPAIEKVSRYSTDATVGTAAQAVGSVNRDRKRQLLTGGKKLRAITESGTAVFLHKDGTWTPEPSGTVQSKEGFRKVSWGASLSEAKTSESSDPLVEESDALLYEIKLGRFSCRAIYLFIGDQLVRGKYIVVDEYQNQTNYLTAYDELKDFVSKKYGTPDGDVTYWMNDLYKDDYSEWGMAVGCGHLSKFANWGTLESKISLGLSGENFAIQLAVEYAGKAFEQLESSVREAELLSDL